MPNINISAGTWDEKYNEYPIDDSSTYLPRSIFKDSIILDFHDFLETLIKDKGVFCGEELGKIKSTDTIESLYKKLNYRIAQCNKFKEEALKLTKELVNNYVIISKYKNKECDIFELDSTEYFSPELNTEVRKLIEPVEQICIGYIYRIILDIRRQSFFHIYFKPIIYTDTKGRAANLQDEEIRNVSFEEISTSYKVITKEEYERKIKELFVKDFPNN